MTAAARYRRFVSVDSAATRATAAWMEAERHPTRAITIAQTATGYAALHQRLRATGHPAAAILVVREATGSSWMSLTTTLAEAGFAIRVINPTQASAFAKALRTHAETDASAAQTIAELGARLQPARWTPPPRVDTELPQRRVQREGLVQLQTHVRTQRHALRHYPRSSAAVERRMEAVRTTRNDQIADVERELATALQHDDSWAAAAARLQTSNGVGQLTARWVLVTTRNVTRCRTPEEAPSHAGLAP